VVDVSSQSCTITPTSPDGLDPSGGVIVDGTIDVMLKCTCVDENGDVVQTIRWFDPSMTSIRIEDFAPDGDLYQLPSGIDTNTLVIPIFSDSTSGIYTCGIGDPPTAMVTINLILSTGKE